MSHHLPPSETEPTETTSVLGDDSSDPRNVVSPLAQAIQEFASKRNWIPYHSAKNLSMALSAEVAEIVEIFQWKSERQSNQLSREERAHLADEVGDVMIYLTYLASQFEIDPLDAALVKLQRNEDRFPLPDSIAPERENSP